MEGFLAEVLASEVPFVVPPPSVLEVECPVCFCLLVNAYLSDCCGHHFCGKCLSKIKNKPCPMCMKRFTTIRNLSLQRAILSMDTYCLHKAAGCEWNGEVRLLYEHLNPMGSGAHGCPCVPVECPLNCGEKCLRSMVEEHKQSKCPERMVTCQFCGHLYKWIILTEEHGEVCPKGPVDCPNGCQSALVRDQVQDHVDSECMLQVVECDFAACKWKNQRKQLKPHLDDSWRMHLLQTTHTFTEKMHQVSQALSDQVSVIQSLSNKVADLEEENSSLRLRMNIVESSVFNLEEKVEELQDGSEDVSEEVELQDDCKKVKELEADGNDGDSESVSLQEHISRTTFAVGRFSRRKARGETYNSPMFYTDSCGYKFRVTIEPNGLGHGAGTHVSLFFHLLPGLDDSKLSWPFQGTVTIALINHSWHGGYYQRTVHYNRGTEASCTRLADDRQPSRGHGFHQFISHDQLQNPPPGVVYLKDDRLEFKILKFMY